MNANLFRLFQMSPIQLNLIFTADIAEYLHTKEIGVIKKEEFKRKVRRQMIEKATNVCMMCLCTLHFHIISIQQLKNNNRNNNYDKFSRYEEICCCWQQTQTWVKCFRAVKVINLFVLSMRWVNISEKRAYDWLIEWINTDEMD